MAEAVVISRRFAAARELVFRAWSGAEHMRRWFAPEGYEVPVAEVDFRAGGALVLCMRGPDGGEHWLRGSFSEVLAPERLAFSMDVSAGGKLGFTARTVVTFDVDGDGCLMRVRQEYEIYDPAFAGAAEGAPEGWRSTLDKLEGVVAAAVVHSSFSIARVYAAPPALVFRALAEPEAKARWFVAGGGYELLEREMDVRPGGRERVCGRWPNGMVSCFDAFYFDVVAGERLVYAYEMHLNERKISVSLATVEVRAEGAGTRLVVTEQGAFFGGYWDGGARERGTGALLDRLGGSLG